MTPLSAAPPATAEPFADSSASLRRPMHVVRGRLLAEDSFQEFAAPESHVSHGRNVAVESVSGNSSSSSSLGSTPHRNPGSDRANERLNAGRGKISDAGRRQSGNAVSKSRSQGPMTATAAASSSSLVVTALRGPVSVATLSWLEKIKRKMGVTRSD